MSAIDGFQSELIAFVEKLRFRKWWEEFGRLVRATWSESCFVDNNLV